MTDRMNGLPFTIDHRRMFEKTIESRSKSPDQHIEEATKLALENASSYVSITERRNGFSIEFDGGGVDSQDGLIELVRNLYGHNKGDMERLGTVVAFSLAKKPESISLTTPCEKGGALRLEIGEGEPSIEPLDEKVENTQFQIRCENKPPKKKIEAVGLKAHVEEYGAVSLEYALSGLGHIKSAVAHPGRAWNSITKGNRAHHKSTFKEIARYSSLEVTYNGERLRTGLFKDDAIFQETYTFDDAIVNLSIPLEGIGPPRKIDFVRNGVHLNSEFYSWAMVHTGKYISAFDNSAPNVVIESAHFNTNISDDVIEDSNYKSLVSRIVKVVDTFHLDYLKGKYPVQNSSLQSRERKARNAFESDLFYNLLESEDFKQALRKRINGEQTKDDGFESLDHPLLEDLWGEQYSLAEAYSAVKENNYTFKATERNNVKPTHPALNLNHDDLAFRLRNRSHKKLLERAVKTMYGQENPAAGRYDDFLGGRKSASTIPVTQDLDDILSTYEENEKRENKKARERVKTATIEGLKTGGYAASVLTLGAGGWVAAPYAVSAAKWAALLAVSNPVVSASPFMAVGAGYGLYKSIPHVRDGLNHTLKATKRVLPQKLVSSQTPGIENEDGKLNSEEKDKGKIAVEKAPTPLKNSPPHERDYFEALVSKVNTGILRLFLGGNRIKVGERNASYFFKECFDEPTYYLDVTGKDFRNRAERFNQEGDAAIYKDIGDIARQYHAGMRPLPHTPENKALVATMFRDTANSVFNEFSEDSEDFREHFPSMSSEARSYILRRILQSGAGGPHDQWLEKAYPRELDQAAQHVMNNTIPEQFSNMTRGKTDAKFELIGERVLDYYTCITPEEVESVLYTNVDTKNFFNDYSIENVDEIRRIPPGYISCDEDDSDASDERRKVIQAVGRAFPVEMMGFAIRNKKEQLDTIVGQHLQGDIVETFLEHGSVWDFAYVHSRVQALTDSKNGLAPYMEDGIYEKMSSALSFTRQFRVPFHEGEMLNDDYIFPKMMNKSLGIATFLLTTHLLQPPGKQGEFKQYLRDNFLHNDAFLLYNAVEHTYSDTLTLSGDAL